jgi:hypothetical protein
MCQQDCYYFVTLLLLGHMAMLSNTRPAAPSNGGGARATAAALARHRASWHDLITFAVQLDRRVRPTVSETDHGRSLSFNRVAFARGLALCGAGYQRIWPHLRSLKQCASQIAIFSSLYRYLITIFVQPVEFITEVQPPIAVEPTSMPLTA